MKTLAHPSPRPRTSRWPLMNVRNSRRTSPISQRSLVRNRSIRAIGHQGVRCQRAHGQSERDGWRTPMNQTELTDFGTRYAAAWSSQHPVSLASFYNENGSLTVNGSAPSVGRTAITETARGFMTAFPDMVVKMDQSARTAATPSFVGRGPAPTPAQEALASLFELAATRSGRLVSMASLRSRRGTSMKRSTNAS